MIPDEESSSLKIFQFSPSRRTYGNVLVPCGLRDFARAGRRSVAVARASLLARRFTHLAVLLGLAVASMQTPSTPSGDAFSSGEPAAECPVTQPNNVAAPAHLEHYVGNGGKTSYFEDGMWVELGGSDVRDDTARFLMPDGTQRNKFAWVRGDGVVGRVVITGERLDGDAPPLRQAPLDDQYGSIEFTPLLIFFPTPGCWEITGTAGGHSLTFVVFLEPPLVPATPVGTPMGTPVSG